MGENYTDIQPLHSRAKDTFFKRVYESEERLRELAGFLLGREAEVVEIRNIRPVLYGNKENDLAFSYDDFIYIMMEEQSSVCYNLPFRMAEYIIVMLRESVDTERLLYGKKRVELPFPKLYGVNVGLVNREDNLPETVTYEMRLSDSYERREGYEEQYQSIDLEAVVHIYDFRMTLQEVYLYLADACLPERFEAYRGNLVDYALTANSLTYVQRAKKEKEMGKEERKYPLPEGINSPADLFQLLISRGVFVDLFQDKEVCDMTVAQFSRDDMLLYQGREEGLEQGREEGLEQGREEGLEQGREEGIRLTKSVLRLDNEGYAVSDIATELRISVEEVKRILEE